jgi:hypothetical protein
MIRKKCVAVFPRDKRGTRLRGDHAKTRNKGAIIALLSAPTPGDSRMPVRTIQFIRPFVAVAMVTASTLYAIAQQPPTPSRVRGTIESVDGDTLAVKSRSGEEVKLHVTGDAHVLGLTRIALADIKVGSFIGTTTVTGLDGVPSAVEVHVFPENMRGTGEGSRPYDLRPNSSMTNATVAESVVGNDGHTLLIKYKDGEKKVQVSPETPVVTYVPGDKSDLKTGAKIIAFTKKLPDGSFETNRVSVGRDGLPPPL